MQIRAAALFALVAMVSIGSVLAQTTEPKLSVSGTVVSTGNTSMVVKSDENGQPMSFLMSTTTLVPAGLSAGSRVTVSYHLIGAAGLKRISLFLQPVFAHSDRLSTSFLHHRSDHV